MKLRNLLVLSAACGILFTVGCGSDDAAAPTGAVGGPVTGDADSHCQGTTPVEVDPAACLVPEDEGEGGASSADEAGAGGAGDCNLTHDDEYGETLSNSEGNDDDCKYHASWTSTPIRLNQDVTFTVTSTNLTTHKPLAALDDGTLPLSRVEVYQPCDSSRRGPAQNAKAVFTETAPGVFSGGPLRFDQPGRWVVRFHFYEQCFDGEGSPHGHVAFFVDVP